MTKLYEYLIGNEFSNTTLAYRGLDSEENLHINLASQPNDWYYRNKTITYQYNEYGHRCKSIHDIDLDNYILFAGCSHTEGVGLELETTFPYLVSNQLGNDYYNMGGRRGRKRYNAV